jgi:hypothetical protein
MSRVKIGLRDARKFIENNVFEHDMTLSEAIEDFLCSHEIPLEQVRTRIDTALLEKLKSELNSFRTNYKKKNTLFTSVQNEESTKNIRQYTKLK